MKTIDKPWGQEIWWADSEHYLAKILAVKAGARLSLQYHKLKHETMYCSAGRGKLQLGEQIIVMEHGVAVDIPAGVVHRLEADADSELTVFEVSTPHPDDIVRLDDAYGRR